MVSPFKSRWRGRESILVGGIESHEHVLLAIVVLVEGSGINQCLRCPAVVVSGRGDRPASWCLASACKRVGYQSRCVLERKQKEEELKKKTKACRRQQTLLLNRRIWN